MISEKAKYVQIGNVNANIRGFATPSDMESHAEKLRIKLLTLFKGIEKSIADIRLSPLNQDTERRPKSPMITMAIIVPLAVEIFLERFLKNCNTITIFTHLGI
jgi:hypothetical protein